jgi:hypothetical protein
LVFKRLGPCTKSPEHLEDFNEALAAFSDEAKQCARLAGEIQMTFNTWGKMVGELHATTEQKYGTTSIESRNAILEERLTEIEKTFASQNAKEAQDAVASANKRLQNSEKRLGE